MNLITPKPSQKGLCARLSGSGDRRKTGTRFRVDTATERLASVGNAPYSRAGSPEEANMPKSIHRIFTQGLALSLILGYAAIAMAEGLSNVDYPNP